MLTGNDLVIHAKKLLGTPYFWGCKGQILTESFMMSMHKAYPNIVTSQYIQKARNKGMVGKVCVDCSGLISSYTGKVLGSAQLYSKAYTRLPISQYRSFANGVVVYRKGHVGIFSHEADGYFVYEARGIDFGTIRSRFDPMNWTCGLTFSWIDYNYEINLAPISSAKGKNPYKEPRFLVKRNMVGEAVKWLQWELIEAGYKLDIDGEFGPITEKCLKDFQTSAKITADGICGKVTRRKLK